MAYTVSEAYNKVLDEADKMGSDYMPLPEMLSLFKKETLGFVREKAKDIEKNQEITTDLVPLVKPLSIALIPNPDVPHQQIASRPSDYINRARVNVQYTDLMIARQPSVIKHGEIDSANASPFKRASKMYPIITQFEDYFNVDSGIRSTETIQPMSLILTYIRTPIFGSDLDDVIVDLDDTVCEMLFSRTANQFMVNKGDPRVQMSVQYKETFGNKKSVQE